LLCHLLEYWTQNKFFTFAHSLTAQPQNLLRKKRKKSSQSQDQAALQQHELYKTCAFAASEIKMHRFKGTYINPAKTYYCQSTIVADFWSSILLLLLLLLLLITGCQRKEPGYKCEVQILQSSDHGTIDLG
jgi:hypothetical protein